MQKNRGLAMLSLTANLTGSPATVHPTLLWDDQHVILVDTGYPGQLDQIRQEMQRAGVPFERLDRVILTHHDIDHIGGLVAIQQALPGQVRVLAHNVEQPYIDGQKRPLKLAQMEANLDRLPPEMKDIYAKLKAGFEHSKAPVDQTLSDGEELPWCGGIMVIFTPGHTLGHICLYARAYQTLIAGDALRVENGQLAPPAPFTNHDNAMALQSLDKLSGYEIKSVISYHGGMVSGDLNRKIAELVSR